MVITQFFQNCQLCPFVVGRQCFPNLNHPGRPVASLTLPGGQDKNISSIFPLFSAFSLIFPQFFLIFFLIEVVRVGESPTRKGPGYATASREIWRKLNSSLNKSYKADEMARLNKQMEELKLADSKGDYSTTWKIIHDLSGKDRNPKVKIKMRETALLLKVTKIFLQNGRST